MSEWVLPKVAAGSVSTPAPGELTVFGDTADSQIKLKDELGAVRPLSREVSTASAVPETANFNAVLGRVHYLDASGGSFNAQLPASNSATLDEEIWFKMINDPTPNAVTVLPDGGGDTVEGLASIDLDLEREFMKFRSDGAGGWWQFG